MSQSTSEIDSSNPLGCFTIQKKLSKSRFSVYQALDTKYNRQVALKVFPKSSCTLHNFQKEQYFFNKLNHPNILRMFEAVESSQSTIEEENGTVSYISLEYAKHGDLFGIISKSGYMSEPLARTLFAQLVEGVSYIHSRKVAHLDLKIANLLIDEEFKLKITDFDLAHAFSEDSTPSISSRGSCGYRAPEIKDGSCRNPIAADIYSLGIILFVLKSKGAIPHTETTPYKGIHLFDLLYQNNDEFWSHHVKIGNFKDDYFEDEFKALFNSLTKFTPSERLSVDKIKNTNWYNGPVYNNEEYTKVMADLMSANI